MTAIKTNEATLKISLMTEFKEATYTAITTTTTVMEASLTSSPGAAGAVVELDESVSFVAIAGGVVGSDSRSAAFSP